MLLICLQIVLTIIILFQTRFVLKSILYVFLKTGCAKDIFKLLEIFSQQNVTRPVTTPTSVAADLSRLVPIVRKLRKLSTSLFSTNMNTK